MSARTPQVGDIAVLPFKREPDNSWCTAKHVVLATDHGPLRRSVVLACLGSLEAFAPHYVNPTDVTVIREASYTDAPEPDPFEVGREYKVDFLSGRWISRWYLGDDDWAEALGGRVIGDTETYDEIRGPVPLLDIDALPVVKGGAS